ncbi:30S ribosomal protein S6 [Candidatus Parcubacteria bacterium]|nr:30S ribosomal protein S6 [Candidatus Parcubacteria bacterium]
MAKNKSNKTPHYEMLYIISNKFTEDELKPIRESIKKEIVDNGGAVTYSEEWGKKKFTYPIEHFHHGYYQLVEFDMEADKIASLDRVFRISNEILRHMLVAKPARSAKEIETEKRAAEKRVAKIKEKEEKEIKKPEKKPEKKKQVDLKDLDEKLDKILETDDLL